MIRIWTDGSHQKGTDDMGIGVYATNGKQFGEMSLKILPNEGSTQQSNPTMEMLAACHALEELLNYPTFLADADGIELYSDYNALEKYANREWNARTAGKTSPWFGESVRRFVSDLELIKAFCPIEVKWVKGHSKDEGNKRADKLAVLRDGRNTMENLFKSLVV